MKSIIPWILGVWIFCTDLVHSHRVLMVPGPADKRGYSIHCSSNVCNTQIPDSNIQQQHCWMSQHDQTEQRDGYMYLTGLRNTNTFGAFSSFLQTRKILIARVCYLQGGDLWWRLTSLIRASFSFCRNLIVSSLSFLSLRRFSTSLYKSVSSCCVGNLAFNILYSAFVIKYHSDKIEEMTCRVTTLICRLCAGCLQFYYW